MIIYMFHSLNGVITGPFGWRDGKMKEWKIFNFPSCVFGWGNGKVEGWKSERIEKI